LRNSLTEFFHRGVLASKVLDTREREITRLLYAWARRIYMGMFIKDMLDMSILYTLTSNVDPAMIWQESVAQAARELIKTVKLLELYPNHQSLVDRFELLREKYPNIYTHRTQYVWQISQTCYQISSLSLSDKDFLKSNQLKCMISFVNILFDDICDLSRDKVLFNKCILALKGHIDQDNSELCELIANTWLEFQGEVQQAPNYMMLKATFENAYQHWITSFEYSLSIQQDVPRFKDHWEVHLEMIAYSSMLYLTGLIDLLFVPNLLPNQIDSAGEVFLRAQKLVQLANWATTWERELIAQDFTSGVFNMAIQNNWIEWKDLESGSLEKVKQQIRNSLVDVYLWKKWDELRIESLQIADNSQLPALNSYVNSLSAIMFMQVGSIGLL
jgi:hypothetical protein